MSNSVIHVENLGKKFVIDHEKTERYTALRDVIAKNVKGAIKRTAGIAKGNFASRQVTHEEFWALKDISFEVKQGDRLGIIGRNGAGKSTLLKVLSRITEPSHGRISIRGRVASLLEVGTGFHPELTGRENIYLNGAILGMARTEIRRKFDEIVDFAEVEKFLDTPVKRYSSGMYVRLAFAVAAHLEPEILIVDEVLAVGDAQFQKKCLGKMEDVSRNDGRTILFVSHQMGTIAQLCDKGILLNKGVLTFAGPISEVIGEYVNKNSVLGGNEYHAERINAPVYFKNVRTENTNGDTIEEFRFDESIVVSGEVALKVKPESLKIGINLQNMYGYVSTFISDVDNGQLKKDTLQFKVVLPKNLIAPNFYYFRVALFNDNQAFEIIESVCSFRIIDTGTSLSKYEGINYGSVILQPNWEVI